MHSRVAAVEAPRTHNRCRATGSSGRRREGRESEPQRPNMSRHHFYSAVPLLLVVMMWMCCNTCVPAAAEDSNSGDVRLPQRVGLFLPQKTLVLPKEGAGPGELKDAFASPSIVVAGEVIVAIAEGEKKHNDPQHPAAKTPAVDIVAGYLNATEPWPSMVAYITSSKWHAQTVFARETPKDGLGMAILPTTLSKGRNLFLLVGSYYFARDSSTQQLTKVGWDIHLVKGEATPFTEGEPSKGIQWGTPQSLLGLISARTEKLGLYRFFGAGGSGIVLERGWLVFPVTALSEGGKTVFIIYSKNDGSDWDVATGTPPGHCMDPLIAEWEEKLLMIIECADGRKVFQSSDVGAAWTEAPGVLSRLWTSKPNPRGPNFVLGDLITLKVGIRSLVLYTQKGFPPGEGKANALYIWVTDNNRTRPVGPISMDDDAESTFENRLLHSNNMLYLLHERRVQSTDAIFLSPLKEELDTINSVVSTWALMDTFFSLSSIPTHGLVAFLSDSATPGVWIDMYRCVNATVTNAEKVDYGFKFPGSGSKGIWPVNRRELNRQYTFVDYNFSLVATVVIAETPAGSINSTPLLGASLEDPAGTNFIGLSCTAEGKWETVFNGVKTTSSSTCEPGKEHQVAIMLQDNRGLVDVDGVIVGNSETMPTIERRRTQISEFYFGGGDGGISVTVTNVFLYNRLLSFAELRMISKTDTSMRGSMPWLLLLLLGLWGFAALYGV
ncbi:putative trans-sialidase, Group II [Trypanosoma cruzi]|uniref:Putative trans-sialidase, Group II n=1 Tax=Trypanosoma cruzi TaxID=5693 RepID=A0A2V2X8C1_TRYCR|nr:putative trans-sialidase, Group II [Trypanosoma cruzi]